jgi:carbonic anhydrase
MSDIKQLLLENKAWAQSKIQLDPNWFSDMARDQSPQHLWIGCADSRVPESEITHSDPGDLFVHRNIANVVNPTDKNVCSVIQYAVTALKVRNIIVCGHYNCGGVKAAIANQPMGLISEWIQNIVDLHALNKAEFEKIDGEQARFDRMVELNVMNQVKHLTQISFIQDAWKNGQPLRLHGWVYDIKTGLLKNLVRMDHAE